MTRPGAIAIDLPPPPAGAVAVAEGLRAAGHEAFFVGGGVRDRILGRAVNDWDVATDAEPEAVMACFGKTIATGLQHGTVTVMQGTLPIEVTTYRVERGYSDGRRPDEVLYTRVLEDDLSRRDFTVNAMAWDPIDGVLVDPFGGRADLERKVLRAVGRAFERFSEDGLRALRAVRFACVLDLRIDPETEAAIPDTLDTFRKVSAERIRVELGKILKVSRAGWGIDGLLRTGLLGEFLPEVAGLPNDAFDHAVAALASIDGEVPRLAALLHAADSDGEAPMRRLKYSTDARRRLMHLLSFRAIDPAAERDDAAVRALVADIEATQRGALDALVAYRRTLGQADAWDALAARIEALGARTGPLRTKDLSLNGKAVMQALDIPPSRRVGRILDALLRRVWADPSLDTPDGLRAILPEVAAEVPA